MLCAGFAIILKLQPKFCCHLWPLLMMIPSMTCLRPFCFHLQRPRTSSPPSNTSRAVWRPSTTRNRSPSWHHYSTTERSATPCKLTTRSWPSRSDRRAPLQRATPRRWTSRWSPERRRPKVRSLANWRNYCSRLISWWFLNLNPFVLLFLQRKCPIIFALIGQGRPLGSCTIAYDVI